MEAFDVFIRRGVGDAGALSKCLREILEDEGLRKRSSEAGRAFAERFDWKSVAEETLALYEELA